MSELAYKPEIIFQLENLLKTKRVIVYACEQPKYLHLFGKELKERRYDGVELWHSIDRVPDDEILKKKTQQQVDEVLEMYRLYDFSDRIMVIDESDQYGTLFNYVTNGLLSDVEMVEAYLTDL